MGIFSARRRKTTSFAARVPILRWLGPSITFAGVCFCAFYLFSSGFRFKAFDDYQGGSTVVGAPVALDGQRPLGLIRVATFNIKTFGEKKSQTRMVEPENVDVMGTIAQIVSQFDLVAIQEVRGKDGMAIRRLIDLLNESGGHYTATLSEPIGDIHYTESYAFVWNQNRIRLIQNSAYVVHDDNQRMYREPMVASFETRVDAGTQQRPFRFTVINAHTDPDVVSPQDVANEINVLDDVFQRVRQYEYDTAGEEDLLLVGDLNVGVNNLQQLAKIPNLISVAGELPTNTRRTATYDHILLDSSTTREFTGKRGVIDFQAHMGMTQEQALLISDHMPVWAEFSAYEAPYVAPVAAQSTRVIR